MTLDRYPLSLYDRGFDRPHFADRDPQEILSAIVTELEQLLQRTLYPAQIERLLANLQAYREVGVRQAIQHTGEQNLAAFATGINLDYLAELMGVYRLGDAPAMTRLRFTLSRVPDFTVIIPEATRVGRGRGAGQVTWATTQSALIRGTTDGGPADLDADGLPYVDVPAIANTNGVVGNGFEPGEINVLISDPFPWFASVVNITQTSQGSPTEDDGRLRRRIMLAPEQFSGGSSGAYKFRVLSVTPHITDVAVFQDTPGHLIIYPLTRDGLPSEELLRQVDRALKPDTRRPITDWVSVAPPIEVAIALNLTVTPYKGRNAVDIERQVRGVLKNFIAERNPVLGIDFVPSQVTSAVGAISGVYRVEVNSPAYQVIEPYEWAHYDDEPIIQVAEAVDG